MKTKQILLPALLAFCALGPALSTAQAQGTAFTYQGRLNNNGVPANGLYDFEFSLYTNVAGAGTQIGSTLTNTGMGVTNGLFITTLNFGDVFTGYANWLAISARSNGAGSYTPLTPLQELTPAPYAIFAAGANATGLTGTITPAQLPSTVVTNNESSVALVSLTLTSNLTLALPATIDVGGNSLLYADNGDNFYIGPNAGSEPSSGSDNTGVGYGSLENNTAGTNNTAVGYLSLSQNTNGTFNVAIGGRALTENTSGTDNTAVGRRALEANTTGTDNAAVGYEALTSNPGGSFNIALGSGAGSGFGNSESSNIDIGNPGVGGDNNIIRIGSEQTNTYIAGVINGNGAGLTNLSAAQLTGSSMVTPPANGYPILNMVYIVPGTFIMGASTNDPDYVSDETQHVVTLTNGFWMGQHPVTQGEYLAVIGSNPSFFTGDLTRPVDSVTWSNATNFCYVLTQHEQSAGRLPAGWVYRLPTESEWEYCCRALTTSRYYFGNDPGDGTSLTNYAWYAVNSGSTTQPVGQLLPNAWGLVDMAGNVFEWCQDWYGTYPTANVSYNPQGPASGSDRVVRGGSWLNPPGLCRSAERNNNNPTDVEHNYGFRIVLAPSQ